MIHEHHRKLRSQGGGDEPTNVIGLPDVVHDWIHANPEKAKDAGLIVPEWDDPAEVKITIPEEAFKKIREKKERPAEKPRNRKTIGVAVPKDEQEDGAGILDDLITQAQEILEPVMGWSETVPPYFVLVAVLHDWVTGQMSIAEHSDELPVS